MPVFGYISCYIATVIISQAGRTVTDKRSRQYSSWPSGYQRLGPVLMPTSSLSYLCRVIADKLGPQSARGPARKRHDSARERRGSSLVVTITKVTLPQPRRSRASFTVQITNLTLSCGEYSDLRGGPRTVTYRQRPTDSCLWQRHWRQGEYLAVLSGALYSKATSGRGFIAVDCVGPVRRHSKS